MNLSMFTTPFRLLILSAGVIWLVRDGKSYVEESMKIEDSKYAKTEIKKFIEMKSARTAVGHDKDGNVLLMQVDGHTNIRG